jgi:hypothetical protein
MSGTLPRNFSSATASFHHLRSTNARVKFLILLCAASAGVHVVLAPMHFEEGIVPGVGFVAAAVLLASVAVALDQRPQTRTATQAAALILGTLLVAYIAARVAAVPLVGEHREPLEPVGVATKLIEVLGIALAVNLTNEGVASRKPLVATPKGVMS